MGLLVVCGLVAAIAIPASFRFRTEQERKKLVVICLGDKEMAQRLMLLERHKEPGISKRLAYRRAVDRYLWHNR